MTIYSDAVGNKFLGDCIWANHNVGFPGLKYLKANKMEDFSVQFTSLLTSAGLPFRNVVPQSNINNWLSNISSLRNSLVHFGTNGDIDDRFSFAVSFNGNNTGSGHPVNLFNNTGSTNVTNQIDESVNLLAGTEYPSNSTYGLNGGILGIDWNRTLVGQDYSPVHVCGVANSNSVGLFFRQQRLISGQGMGYLSEFFYAGKLDDINTNFDYYNINNITQSFIMSGGNNSFTESSEITALNGRHYISSTAKYPLETGDAQYPIVCADAQTPTSQWATDFYVFDNNATLGYPAIGKVRNLLLAQGNFTIGKPVRIQGTTQPDAGSNAWLPVGTFAGKTVLMRCYSSVLI